MALPFTALFIIGQLFSHLAHHQNIFIQICMYDFHVVPYNTFQLHYGPGVDSASNTNDCQEYLLGEKAASA
jgi:hypothetical protein